MTAARLEPKKVHENWMAQSKLPAWRDEAREGLNTVLEHLMQLESKLTEYHDHANLYTMEFMRAGEMVASAWRAANYAPNTIEAT